MVPTLVEFALRNRALVLAFGIALLFGGLYAFHRLDVVAYPDPSPPMVEVITQNSALSADEIERQITLPIEYALAVMPGLTHTRSVSLFGLSDIKFYFDYDIEYVRARHEVLTRLAFLDLPAGVQPTISPWWALAEVYRYELVGDGQSLTDLKTIEDWQLNREFKRVRGVIDVTAFGGTTKQYHVDLDPGLLFSYAISTPQVLDAIRGSNANAGGNYLTVGSQSFDVRGVGLIRDLDDIENVVVSEKDGTPILVKNLGQVRTGYRVRLGKVGIDDRDDVLEGVVLLMRGYESLPVVEAVQAKVAELNGGRLPDGVQIKTVYDRSTLIHTTIETVMDILISGVCFVFATLFIFLGHFRTAVIVALAVPIALLFTFILMIGIGESANLISLGAIDFGIIVDSTLLIVENVFFQLTHRRDPNAPVQAHIVRAAKDVGRPIFFATTIIIIAFVPLFTMGGVPGRIFAPMSVTYGFALTGALITVFTLAPVLASWLLRGPLPDEDTRLVRWIRRRYLAVLAWALDRELLVILFAVCLFAAAIAMWFTLGGEFMPALEEGNIWLRATMPIGISFEEASRVASDMRKVFRQYPETRTAVSQLGRPDDGTDPTSFFNAEFLVDLKPRKEWRDEIGKKSQLIAAMEQELSEKFPGVTLNFSQMIQDNVQEAMTGVKGENSVKIFGHDLGVLEDKAEEVRSLLSRVRGIRDLGVLHTLGQPNLLIEVDRSATARYGLEVDDVNAVIQAAIGGQSVTQVFEGEKWFDLVVRYLPEYRKNAQRIGDIQVMTSSGSRIPLKQLALIKESVGPFMVYRENNHRYIPVKFSVRGRDLETTVKEAQRLIAEKVELPKGYRIEWHGEFTQLQGEKQRLAIVVPLSLLVILLIVSYALHSFRDGLLVLAAVPFALVGGIIALFVTGTHFSISAAVGFLSVFGVAIQGALVDISRLHEYFDKGFDLRAAILKNAEVRMRPVMMTTLSAAIGLIPASVATGIGAQSQQPLARVVVGGMLSAVMLILIVLPVFYQRVHRREHQQNQSERPKGAVGYSAALMMATLLLTGCGQHDDVQALSTHPAAKPSLQSNIVSVSPRAQEELIVQEVRPRPLTEEFVVQGRMQYGPDGYVNVSSPVTGIVKQVRARLGEEVRAGQVLVTIQSADVGTAYSDFTKAESELDFAQRSYLLAKDLLKVKAIPEKEYEQTENDYLKAKAEYDRARRRLLILRVPESELNKPPDQRTITARFDLKAPLEGVVVEKDVTVGEVAAPGESLYTIANPDLLQAVGEIYERDLRVVKAGMPAVVRSESFPSLAFPATIRYVGDRVDPVSRTIKIRCDVNNIEQKLKVDMFVRIHIGVEPHLTGLVVPEEAVLRLGEATVVFVEQQPGEYERRRVEIGSILSGQVEIREGLISGDRVVVRGGLLLEGAMRKREASFKSRDNLLVMA